MLVSDEYRFGIFMTKLPGGGLEFGEGPAEGLKREWMEEAGMDMTVGNVIYVNPFHQLSAFNDQHDMVSMYFLVKPRGDHSLKISEAKFDFPPQEEGQSFRWINLSESSEDDFTFPIDKALARWLSKNKLPA